MLNVNIQLVPVNDSLNSDPANVDPINITLNDGTVTLHLEDVNDHHTDGRRIEIKKDDLRALVAMFDK